MHYEVTKPNKQHQFDLLCVAGIFEGNTYKYISLCVDVASSYKVATPFRTEKANEVAFVLEAVKKIVCLNTQRYFNVIMGQSLKVMSNLLEKHNVDIWRTAIKYKHIHIAFVEAFNKELAIYLFKPEDAHDL